MFGLWKAILGIFVIILLVGLGAFGAAMYMERSSASTKVVERTFNLKEANMTDLSVYAEKDIQIRMKAEEAKLSVPLLGPVLKSSRIVLLEATCQAGIDYKSRPAKVEYASDKKGVKITIQDVQILNCRALPNGVEYIDSGGIIPASTELSNQLYAKAMDAVQAKAEDSDLIPKARQSAAMSIELAARQYGFQDVQIVFEAPPEQ